MFTLTDNQKLEIIERYLSDELSPKEQTVFQELLTSDEDFALAVLFQKDLMPSIAANGRQSLKLQFEELEKTIVAKNSKTQATVLDKIKQSIEAEIKELGYTIEQFLQLFAPVPNYTTAIAATTRGNRFSLLSPENKVDCSEGFIRFDFGKALNNEIEILIEDNQHNVLIEEEVRMGQREIVLDLPVLEFKAGRYYWKIIADEELVMIRTFFVRKDLVEGLGVDFEV